MRKGITQMSVALAAAAALSIFGMTEAGPSGAATSAAQPRGAPAAGAFQAAPVSGTQLWVKRYNGASNGQDQAASVAVSPGGGRVFVTGSSWGGSSGNDYATVAYRADTGARLWVKRYNGPANSTDQAWSVAVSPAGGTVFVTGNSAGATSKGDYATIAYNAATGTQLWVKRYNGPASGTDQAVSVAVSPGGGRVFVTGSSWGGSSGKDYTTVAYRADSGKRLWVTRYNGPGNGYDGAARVAVSPTGGTVFVTGRSLGGTTAGYSYATIAYNAATGAQSWVSRYNGPAGPGANNNYDSANSVAVSPSGKAVFVTGTSPAGATGSNDYATVAYNAATGARLWVTRYDQNGEGEQANAVAVSPSGGTVFVTGEGDAPGQIDFVTVAYNAVTGAQLWATRYSGGWLYANSVAVNRTGTKVFVTGADDDSGYITVAYNAATGAQLWAKRYGDSGGALSVAVSPTSGTVFVTGGSGGDYTTIAYTG